MEYDAEGFAYPSVDFRFCINCRLCEKTCPRIYINKEKVNSFIRSYAAIAKDDLVRQKSSSGGIFWILASDILAKGGIVFGAAMNDYLMVYHTAVESTEELIKLQGSKYVQSKIAGTYAQAKKALSVGRYVLYSGTACQIAGLMRYLDKEYEKLYTVDVLCHGVPSSKVWERYIREQEATYGASVKEAYFRDKKLGWKKYSLMLVFKNGESYIRTVAEDNYFRLFLANYSLRPSCYSCIFKSLERYSDITIGDCWGIETYMPDMDDDKGTSVVLVHTEKGQKLFNQLAPAMQFREGESDKLVPPTSESRIPVKEPIKRQKFFKMFERGKSINDLACWIRPSLSERVKNAIMGRLLSKIRKDT
jgi:coenzyme F420-reducing hydrogenase beta subunit